MSENCLGSQTPRVPSGVVRPRDEGCYMATAGVETSVVGAGVAGLEGEMMRGIL